MKTFQISSILEPRQKPDVSKLITDMENAITDSSDFHARMEHNESVKGCSWDGQSLDGRKHAEDLDEEALPWEGASDARIPLAKILVNEFNLLATTALTAGLVQAEAIDSAGDPAAAQAAAPVLKWIRSGPRRKRMRDQVDFLVNGMNTYGHAVCAIDWHEERQLTEETLSEEDLLGMAGELALASQDLPELGEQAAMAQAEQLPEETAQKTAIVLQQTEEQLRAALLDPEQTDKLVDLVDALLNPEGQTVLSVPINEVRRVVKSLQSGEPGVYYRPTLKANEPRFMALMPWVDVFYPAQTTQLSDAPWIARVHWLNEAALKDRAELEEWDKEWLDAVMQKPGQGFSMLGEKRRKWVLGGAAVYRGISNARMEEMRQFQVIELFQVATCQGGVPVLYRTVLHPGVTDKAALHEPLVHGNAEMPFVDFRRERTEGVYLLDSRGIPEMVSTQQNALKRQHDGRTDRTDIELMPPALVPTNRSGNEWSLGPHAQIPVRRSGTLEFMKIPAVSIDTSIVAKEEWALVDKMFGRMSADVPAALTQLHYSKVTSDFLVDIGAAFQIAWNLCMAWWSDEVWQRISGAPKPAPDPYGFDLAIVFDVRNLNMEWVRELMEVYSLFVLPADAEGVFDRGKFVSYLTSVISPQMAGQFIIPKDVAEQSELEDELTQLAIIMSGAEPPQKQGQNYALRLQVLNRFTQSSMEIQRKVQDNQQIKEVLSARMAYFQNQLQQSQNAIIGRTMQQPVMQ